MKSAFVFIADLTRRLSERGMEPELDFIRAASYGSGTTSSGQVRILLDITLDLDDRDVLLIDDIADSGLTLDHISKHLHQKGAKSVTSCVLLDKPTRRKLPFKPDYIGFTIPDLFVVGYGIDYDEQYRYLPFIGYLANDSH